jgi:hypothetical protein
VKVLKKSSTPPASLANSDSSTRGIDARQRHIGQHAEDDQRAEREPEALLEIGRLGELRQACVGSKLLGCGCHGFIEPS